CPFASFLMDVRSIASMIRFARQVTDFSASFNRSSDFMATPAQKPSLYERLGGIYPISCVVDDLIDRVMTDARLNANPLVNEAHHKVPPPGFKYLVTEIVGW